MLANIKPTSPLGIIPRPTVSRFRHDIFFHFLHINLKRLLTRLLTVLAESLKLDIELVADFAVQ